MVWPSRCPVCVTPRSSVSATNNSTLAPVWPRPTPMLRRRSAYRSVHVARSVGTVPAQAVFAAATPGPAGRWGYANDVVRPAVWFASTASDFLNVQVIYVDGGMTAVLR